MYWLRWFGDLENESLNENFDKENQDVKNLNENLELNENINKNGNVDNEVKEVPEI